MVAEGSSWKSKFWLALLGLCGLSGLAWLPVDHHYLREQAALQSLKQIHIQWRSQLAAAQALTSTFPWRWSAPASVTAQQQRKMALLTRVLAAKAPAIQVHCLPAPCTRRLLWEFRRQGLFPSAKQPSQSADIQISLRQTHQRGRWLGISFDKQVTLEATVSMRQTQLPWQKVLQGKAIKAHYQWTALLPPLLAIVLALLTRRILLSLFLSLLIGTILLYQDVWSGSVATFHIYIWKKAIFKEFSFNIIFFTLGLIGMINVCTRNGGVRGLIARLLKYAETPRSSRILTALLGLLIFFDDYANTIMVGNTMRPLTDRYRVSREKLAYLVDSTAAPIAGLAVLSTWIGYEVGLLGDIANHLGLGIGGYQIFLNTLPFRFYCWMTLIFVFMCVILDRDFGPMLRAERRAWQEGKLIRDGGQPMIDMDTSRLEPPEGIPFRAINILLPIAVVFVSIALGLMWVGGAFAGNSIYAALKEASFHSSRVFLISALIGSALAIGLSVGQHLLTWTEAITAWLAGARAMVMAVGILIFAWAMSALAQDLGTAYFLIALLQGNLHPTLLPLLVFFMSAAVSFATGTSWGTMGILLPTIGPLALSLGGMPIFVLSVGAVLDGSIFGDHCSPLSDTTLFSSAASGCDHIDHVKTQVPYATTVMAVASTCGYLAVAMGMSVWFAVLAAFVIFGAVFVLMGQPTNPPATTTEAGTR